MVDMTSPALSMLLERLLSPIPRVRWEAGRSVACLVRNGHANAANALLGWIRSRNLESEAILGLGVIDAYRLGQYFDGGEVCSATRAPSLLSDYLLRRNFGEIPRLAISRHTVSPRNRAKLNPEERTWFDRYRDIAAPGMFSGTLTWLQDITRLPFMARWKHDWEWLQATDPRPRAEFPSFFSNGDHGRTGRFMVGQTELYISAYLRTLTFAAMRGWIPKDVAQQHAMLGLTMNRGLAELEPIDRPDWARGLLPWDVTHNRQRSRQLWSAACTASETGEIPAALRVVDVDTRGFVEVEVTLVVGSRGLSTGPAAAHALKEIFADQRRADMAGPVGQSQVMTECSIERPLFVIQQISPGDYGRLHGDMSLEIRLASPYVFVATAEVQCRPTDIRLVAGSEVLSRWMHWYADWEPTMLAEMSSFVSSITTVSESALNKLRTRNDTDVAKLVRVRRGTRPEFWGPVDVGEETFWI